MSEALALRDGKAANPDRGNYYSGPGQLPFAAGGEEQPALNQKRLSGGGFRQSPTPVEPQRGDAEPLTCEQVQQFRQAASRVEASDEVADELSLSLDLVQRIRSQRIHVDSAYSRFQFVFDCLVAERPQLTLARDERIRLQFEVYRQSGLISRMLTRVSAGNSAALVAAAILISVVVWAGLAYALRWLLDQRIANLFGDVFFMNGQALAAIAPAAFIGSIISMTVRLRDFACRRDLDPLAVFWTAMLKPLIGVAFSVFLLAMLAGGIVNLGLFGERSLDFSGSSNMPAKALYILWILGFLSGFAERLTWDFIDRAQPIAAPATSCGPIQSNSASRDQASDDAAELAEHNKADVSRNGWSRGSLTFGT